MVHRAAPVRRCARRRQDHDHGSAVDRDGVPELVRSRDAVARHHRAAGGPVRFRDWCRPWRRLDRGGMRRTVRTVAASLVAVFTVVVDNTKVNVALPTLARALAVDETTLQWVVESYVLAFAALLLLGGAVA